MSRRKIQGEARAHEKVLLLLWKMGSTELKVNSTNQPFHLGIFFREPFRNPGPWTRNFQPQGPSFSSRDAVSAPRNSVPMGLSNGPGTIRVKLVILDVALFVIGIWGKKLLSVLLTFKSQLHNQRPNSFSNGAK